MLPVTLVMGSLSFEKTGAGKSCRQSIAVVHIGKGLSDQLLTPANMELSFLVLLPAHQQRQQIVIDIKLLVDSIDNQTEPACGNLRTVAVGWDKQIGIVKSVNTDVPAVGEVNFLRGKEVSRWYFFKVHVRQKTLCGHFLDLGGQGSDRTFIPAEEVVEDVNGKFIFVIRDNDFVSTLTQVVACRMDGSLQGSDGIAFFIFSGIAPGLMLEDQKKAARNRFPGTDLLNELQIVFLHQTALLVGFHFHFSAYRFHMQVDIRTAGKHLELHPDGTDLQVRNKGVNDIPLFSGTAEQKVDGDDLYDFYIAAILRIKEITYTWISSIENRKALGSQGLLPSCPG